MEDVVLGIYEVRTQALKHSLDTTTAEDLFKNIVLYEFDRIFFKINLPKSIDPLSVALNITDISLEPTYYEEFTYWTFEWKNPNQQGFFQNLVGEASLSVSCNDFDDVPYQFSFGSVEVLPSKATSDDVIDMVKYIGEGISSLDDSLLLNVARSATLFMGFEDIIGRKKFLERLNILKDSVDILKTYMPNILAKPISNLTTEYQISYFDNEMDVDIDWAVDNIYSFTRTGSSRKNSFFHKGYNYEQNIYRNRIVKYNFNVYENITILQFVKSLIDFCYEAKNKFHLYNNYSNEYENIDKKSLFEIVRSEECRFYKNSIRDIDSFLLYLESLKKIFMTKLSVKLENIQNIKMTAKIKANFYYRTIFEKIYKWNNYSQSVSSVAKNKNGIKTLDKIYEVFCWFKLYFSFIQSGFKLNDKYIANTECFGICFENSDTKIDFLYEPKYYLKNSASAQKYYNTEKWNFSQNLTLRKNMNYRSPDFVLNVTDKKTKAEKLIILDAKYTSSKNAFKKYLPECTMKYVHGMGGSEHVRYSPVKAFYILFHGDFGDRNSNVTGFHHVQDRFNVYSDSPIFPMLGCVKISSKSMFNCERFLSALITNILK